LEHPLANRQAGTEPTSAYLTLVVKGSTGPPLYFLPGWNGKVSWQSVGKRSPRNLFLTVYAAEKDGRRQSKLWAEPAGPNYGTLYTDFHLGVLANLPDHLLICLAYVDESMKKYRQAFRYRVLPPVSLPPASMISAQLEEELPRPSGEICR
jgi:hypothetical protein